MLHRARALWCCGSRRPPPRAAKDARGKTGPDIQIGLLDLSEKCPKLAFVGIESRDHRVIMAAMASMAMLPFALLVLLQLFAAVRAADNGLGLTPVRATCRGCRGCYGCCGRTASRSSPPPTLRVTQLCSLALARCACVPHAFARGASADGLAKLELLPGRDHAGDYGGQHARHG
eukprot:COSAG06_NODE_552_length_14385_cov_7.790424_5_plen_175_part_00